MDVFSEQFEIAACGHIQHFVFTAKTKQEIDDRAYDIIRTYAAYDCVSRERDLNGRH